MRSSYLLQEVASQLKVLLVPLGEGYLHRDGTALFSKTIKVWLRHALKKKERVKTELYVIFSAHRVKKLIFKFVIIVQFSFL